MPEKPQHISGYLLGTSDSVERLCLFVATRLGDFMPRLRVVGGLVPRLLIRPPAIPGVEPHVGTQDLDLGFELTLLHNAEYEALAARLRSAGLRQDLNPGGQPTRQRWVYPAANLTVDFLIPPVDADAEAGGLQSLEHDFAAVITPGLGCAFEDFEVVAIDGTTIAGEAASRDIWVCGPGAFVILKALALRNRGERKDAYDLNYVLRNWPGGLDEIATRVRSLSQQATVEKALECLREDFGSVDSVGARQLDRFLGGDNADDENLRADAVALVREFLKRVRGGTQPP